MLVVDDNASSRRILEEMLTGWRMIPTAVDGGPAALAELQRAAACGKSVSVVADRQRHAGDGRLRPGR